MLQAHLDDLGLVSGLTALNPRPVLRHQVFHFTARPDFFQRGIVRVLSGEFDRHFTDKLAAGPDAADDHSTFGCTGIASGNDDRLD